jgi:transcriptional regulator with XRE-family HTH domain
MTTNKHAKGVKANGTKIRELRLKANKSQKSLINGSTVELRTLQRAEKGEPVLPAILQQIAQLLEVPLTDLTLASHDHQQTNAYRLYNARTVGGRRLFSALHDWDVQYHYAFSIDPDQELATSIAATIRYFQSLAITTIDDYVADPADKILTIGRINNCLAELENKGVWIYFGKFTECTVKKESTILFGPDLTGAGTVSPSNVAVSFHAKIRFSNENVEYLTDSFYEVYTRDRAEQKAIRENLERGIHPDWLDACSPLVFHSSFLEAYRKAHGAAQKSRPVLAITHTR